MLVITGLTSPVTFISSIPIGIWKQSVGRKKRKEIDPDAGTFAVKDTVFVPINVLPLQAHDLAFSGAGSNEKVNTDSPFPRMCILEQAFLLIQ